MSIVQRGALLAATALLFCVASPPALAGSVNLEGASLVFQASPGESNNLTITQSEGSFTVVDNWPITSTGSCASIDLFTTVCTGASDTQVTVRLGDGDDTVVIDANYVYWVLGEDGADSIKLRSRVEEPFSVVNGGRGDDTLINEFGPLGLNGGGGDDTLITYSSHIRMRGWGGDDFFDGRAVQTIYVDAGPGRDRVLGGYGYDELSGGGGRDVLIGGRGAEDLSGGLGDDVLRGGPGANRMHGDGGDDLIVGGRHREFFVYGGGGSDTFVMRDGKRDTMHGEGGRDRARIDRRLDRPLGVEVIF